MKIESLRDLFIHQLHDLRSAETQITKALPKMIRRSESTTLSKVLEYHLRDTLTHVNRLDAIIERLGGGKRSVRCKGMEGILAEGGDLADSAEPYVVDAAIVAAAQHVEHYEMAAYGTALAFAEALGESDAALLLAETLEEEKIADKTLTRLAESGINVKADSRL